MRDSVDYDLCGYMTRLNREQSAAENRYNSTMDVDMDFDFQDREYNACGIWDCGNFNVDITRLDGDDPIEDLKVVKDFAELLFCDKKEM